MLTERPLHLMLYVPSTWQVLRLQSVNEMLSPHPDEVLERSIIIALTSLQDRLDHLRSVWIRLLLVAQLKRLEPTLAAAFDQVKDLASITLQGVDKMFRYKLFDVVLLLNHHTKL